ncbi:MAG TPA: PLP-dependent aminotransferase family protein [Iamia sp.]|nr:PLP-dependent aminotransferase family protein [Iamia sp.]
MAGIDLFRDEVARGVRELQFTDGGHRLDLTWGHPDPTLLPVEELGRAAEAVLGERGWRALSYGTPEGSGRLRHVLADRLAVGPDEIVVTYGSSGALDLVLGVRAEPGDVVLVEQPTYFLALRIIADRRLRTVGLPPGAGDPSEALAEAVGRLRTDGHRGRTFLYVCPTHSNPTGRTMTEADRRTLIAAARDHDVVVLEDDVYGELGPEDVSPLWSLDPERVIRLGSFSKTIAPGLRLGFARAAPPVAAELAGCGLLDSGGGANPLVAAVVAELIASGVYDVIVSRLAATYRQRMGVLLSRLDDAHLPAGRPTAGYFAWISSPSGSGPDDVVAAAAAEGVAVAPAQVFHVDPVDRRSARISCSLLAEADLAEASARLGRILGSGGPGDRS